MRIQQRLRFSAQRHCRAALGCVDSGDVPGFYLHAGIGVELAMKARLIAINLVFLVEDHRDWFEQWSRLDKMESGRAKIDDEFRVRSVNANAALGRLKCIDKANFGDAKFIEHVEMILCRRNEAAHLGFDDHVLGTIPVGVPASFIHCVESSLFPDLQEFWGDSLATRKRLISEEFRTAQIAVETATTKARQVLESLVSVEEIQIAERQASHLRAEAFGHGGASHQCPVCGHDGVVSGPVQGPFYEYERSVEGDWDVSDIEVLVVPTSFECGFCGYALTDRIQLDVASFPKQVRMTHLDDPKYSWIIDAMEDLEDQRQEALANIEDDEEWSR